MKISQFQLLSNLQRDILIPVSINGRNLKVTLGQILDEASRGIVPFDRIQARPESVTIIEGSDTITQRTVIFDTTDNRFYMAIHNTAVGSGQTIESWTYYRKWSGSAAFMDESGATSRTAVFCAADGRFYTFNGTTLIRAGISQEEADQIRHSSMVRVATEEDMENLIKAGEIDPEQEYYVPEES